MITVAIFLLGLAASSKQAIQSPCPDVLSYEEKSADEPSRLYGRITFPSTTPRWLFMTVILNKKADLLGNWLGEVSSRDNIEFRMNNPEFKTQRKPMRFFVKHDPEDETPPKVQLIKLDDQEICNADKPVASLTTEAPQPSSVSPVIIEVPQQSSGSAVNNPQRSNGTDPANFRLPINYYTANEAVQCGVVKMNNPVALVVDGAPTLEGQWPWQVALYRTQWVNQNYICGGTLVSHRHVVTAAHCTSERNSRPPQKVDESSLTVYLGKHDLVTSVVGVQIRFVERITNHPDYDTRVFSRDLSVLMLQKPVQYSNWVQPACLWPDALSDIGNIVEKRGSVVGWGSDGSGKLLLVEMPVVNQETCIRSKGDFFLRVTSNYTFCAGDRNGKSPCNGDSGGGMVFRMNGAWYLRGVVSIALSKDNESACDPFHYVVFTDVAQFLPWIRENVEPY